MPTATVDTGSVIEGDILTVDATSGLLANDTFGADGPATNAISGVAAGSNTTTALTTGVGSAISGAYGILTLQADGSYTYQATANNIAADANDVQDTFVYTITDDDGDTSTVTLTIDVTNIALIPVNPTVSVDEAALPTGSDPSSTAEAVSGTLVVAGTGIEYTLDSNPAGNNGTLTLNQNTGEFTYTLTSPVDSGPNPGTNTVNGVETFNYTATDDFGNTTTGIITINVIDDVPSIVNSEITPLLQESFENLLANANSGWTVVAFGETYTGDHGAEWDIGATGLEAQKQIVTTSSDGLVHVELDAHNNVTMSTSVTISKSDVSLSFDYKPRTSNGDSNMKVTVDGREIIIDSQNPTSAIITTPDGVSATQTLNASGWFSITLNVVSLTPGEVAVGFEGIGPSNSLGALLDNISLSENYLQVDESTLNVDASHDFSGYFIGSYGADGPGDITYNLSLNSNSTGLMDTATGENIILSLNTISGAIEGRTEISDNIAFTVNVNNSGVVTLDQLRALIHTDDNQVDSVLTLPSGLIDLNATITDSDNDSATTQLDISATISFRDDAPVITASEPGGTDQDSFIVNGDERVSEVQSDPANGVVDHWQFHHDGGQLVIDLNSERFHGDLDGDGDTSIFDSYIYLFTTDGNGNIENLVTRNDDDGFPHVDSKITINLAEGDYDLAVGAWPFTETEARGETHDRPMGTYNINFSGDNDGVILQASPNTGTVLESTVNVETSTAILSVSHDVDIDIGADEAGSSLDFSLEEVTILGDLTSNGLAVTFEARDTDSDGHNDQIVGSTGEGDILSIDGILDSDSEVHLFAPIDSNNIGTDDIQITANLSVTDGDGDNISTTLNFNLDINQITETVTPHTE